MIECTRVGLLLDVVFHNVGLHVKLGAVFKHPNFYVTRKSTDFKLLGSPTSLKIPFFFIIPMNQVIPVRGYLYGLHTFNTFLWFVAYIGYNDYSYK